MSSIKLEAGKKYKSKDGRVFGPMNEFYPNRFCEKMGDGRFWTPEGNGHDNDRRKINPKTTPQLVDEWTDELDGVELDAPEPSQTLAEAARDWWESGTSPERVKILNDGAALTNGDRDDEYGPPANNMACAGELKATFRRWLARDISPGELEALDMAMTKLSRLACGKPKRDTYVDAATYIAIAGEVALKA